MTPEIPLYEWSAHRSPPSSPYQPPEAGALVLQGHIRAGTHPVHRGSGYVTTSPVVLVTGRLVRTASGSTYRLEGDPKPDWRAAIEKMGREYNPEAPLGPAGARS